MGLLDKKTKKSNGGRPTDYSLSRCGELILHRSNGLSLTEAAVKMGVCRDTLYEWAKQYPEFSDAMKKAYEQSLSFWENKLRVSAFSPAPLVNSTLIIFAMKNMFRQDYGEKQQNEEEQVKPGFTVSLDENA